MFVDRNDALRGGFEMGGGTSAFLLTKFGKEGQLTGTGGLPIVQRQGGGDTGREASEK